jgi:hypothetical protein
MTIMMSEMIHKCNHWKFQIGETVKNTFVKGIVNNLLKRKTFKKSVYRKKDN